MVWESVIERWDQPHRLSYRQGRGPYSWFWHDHIVEPVMGGTRITDVVEYDVPGGAVIGRAVNATVVLPLLRRIFSAREERLLHLLGAPPPPSYGSEPNLAGGRP